MSNFYAVQHGNDYSSDYGSTNKRKAYSMAHALGRRMKSVSVFVLLTMISARARSSSEAARINSFLTLKWVDKILLRWYNENVIRTGRQPKDKEGGKHHGI